MRSRPPTKLDRSWGTESPVPRLRTFNFQIWGNRRLSKGSTDSDFVSHNRGAAASRAEFRAGILLSGNDTAGNNTAWECKPPGLGRPVESSISLATSCIHTHPGRRHRHTDGVAVHIQTRQCALRAPQQRGKGCSACGRDLIVTYIEFRQAGVVGKGLADGLGA